MDSPIKYAAIASGVLIVVMGLFTAASANLHRRKNPGTPAEETTAPPAVTREIIVASKMPERISMDIPAGFSETSSDFYDCYYIREDASIITTGEEKSVPVRLSDYSDSVLKQYQDTADGFELESDQNLQIGGKEARVFEFRYDIGKGENARRMRCMSGVFVDGHGVFIVTCKSRYETYGAYRDDFVKTVQSVKIAPEPDLIPSDETTATTAVTPAFSTVTD